jgi:hypothetical protein
VLREKDEGQPDDLRVHVKYVAPILATALLASAPAAAGDSSPARGFQAHTTLSVSSAQYVPRQLIVSFRTGAGRAAIERAHARVGARVTRRFPAFRMQLVTLRPGLAVRDALRDYQRDPAVAFAEPNYLRHPSSLPTDALFLAQWDLNNTGQTHPVFDADGNHVATPRAGTAGADIDAPEAWGVQMGNGTIVAVLDSGLDVSHPDLASQLWTNPGETPSDGLDNDGNGKIDDVHGWDFGDNDASLLGLDSLLRLRPWHARCGHDRSGARQSDRQRGRLPGMQDHGAQTRPRQRRRSVRLGRDRRPCLRKIEGRQDRQHEPRRARLVNG